MSTKDKKLRTLQNVYISLREKVMEKFDEKISESFSFFIYNVFVIMVFSVCVRCKKFVDGICSKHPLIFVHEKVSLVTDY